MKVKIEQLEKYLNVNLRGVNHIGLCPFHKEKRPSFAISIDKQLYKCFGCNKGGTLEDLLKELEENHGREKG